ncbi:aminodeoxychorismate synthase component I [Ideonella sp.]|uniref:aminodeoxychorismate synthase component I n=1 Tax=Ideonella sp. TaxID=1929293 RepID=UPI002B48290E|nr:aminodeoxychorismate synthase component I [Ideonella sp.]HJV72122.1 aminodeoxychorismate synthase component I [Ideonella sp.]
MDVFALLDDCEATAERPSSRLYEGFVREHRCTDPAELEAVWARVDEDQRAGLHAVLLADYEWGAKLLKAGHAGLAPADASCLRVLMFERLQRLSREEVDVWLAERALQEPPGAAGVMSLEPSVDRAAFTEAITRVHEAIRAGETYQINYTYRLHGQAYGSPLALYRQLRQRQPVAYGAFIGLPGGEAVLSCSPELFVRHEWRDGAGLLTARPMKGTAPRIAEPQSDSETARLLSLDIKNRAENLMIVDLLRNDLGRISRIGSVKVPALFAIEPYATVFQMTSTVQAEIQPELGFGELLRAVFPCGSITGAPKHHTMELIAEIETTPRGLYCGAIGWVDAPKGGARLGDFCLSVVIRTLTLGAPAQGLRPARLGIGAGIVLDSQADDEFEECRLKARFLTGLDPGFALFETLRWTHDQGLHQVDRHLARLAHSARVLGFAFDEAAARLALAAAAKRLPAGGAARVRLALAHDGRLACSHGPLAPLAAPEVTLLIADEALPDHNPLAAHKTTLRRHYDAGVRAAEQAGAFDSLFFTTDGRLAEGGRSSVFLKIGGQWWTPPVADGALPGVMRGLLLEDPAWAARERSLRRGDLLGAEAIVVCNALRGALPARLSDGMSIGGLPGRDAA